MTNPNVDGVDTGTTPGGLTAGAVTVHEPGADDLLAGPGTGRNVTGRADARVSVQPSFDPASFGAPTRREEEWRFTPLRRLKGLHAEPSPVADGKVVLEVDAAPEVTVSTIERSDALVGSVLTPVDRVSAVAMKSFSAGTLVSVPRNAVASAPTVLTFRGEGGTAYGHVVVDVAEGAEAVVVLDHSGTATYASNVEFRVGNGASLTAVSLQDWDAGAVHVGALAAAVGRDARFRSIVVTFGGDLVRLSPTVKFTGPGGDAELLGLYFADAGQHLEHRLFVDHCVPHCKSNVMYKGALQGADAHTVWIGDVMIRAAAVGTDTYELNRNLLLGDGPRADSVPNLEIETGEVAGAGHASATGRFDDEQLFYLQSRGIPADLARRLVVRGFFADVIQQIGIPALQERLLRDVDAELERVGA